MALALDPVLGQLLGERPDPGPRCSVQGKLPCRRDAELPRHDSGSLQPDHRGRFAGVGWESSVIRREVVTGQVGGN